MKTLLILPLLLAVVVQAQTSTVSNDGSSVAVLTSKWYKSRQVLEKTDNTVIAPAPAVTANDKNYERNRRVNDAAGARDPNADTVDTRSAALEKSVQDARHPTPKPVNGFAYRVKVQNTSAKTIEVLFWEYQFKEVGNPQRVARRQFLCGVNIKPSKEKELQAFSLSGPSDVISVESLSKNTANLFQEQIVINRVEYSDGTIWQRKDWNFAEIRSSLSRALSTPWAGEMCRGL